MDTLELSTPRLGAGGRLATRGRRRRRLFRIAGALLLALGVLSASAAAAESYSAAAQQRTLQAAWRAETASVSLAALPPPVAPDRGDRLLALPAAKAVPGPDGSDFMIVIPRLGYRAVVREGVSSDVLAGSPGHYPETPWPGWPGNVGVAAHNTYWLFMGSLRADDEIQLETRYGTAYYRVAESRVVDPDDRTVLAPLPGQWLTLTTCWPLWAGAAANQRLYVRAEQVTLARRPVSA